jgi:hypothetical protein
MRDPKKFFPLPWPASESRSGHNPCCQPGRLSSGFHPRCRLALRGIRLVFGSIRNGSIADIPQWALSAGTSSQIRMFFLCVRGFADFQAPMPFIGADHWTPAAAAHAFHATAFVQLGTTAGTAMAENQAGELHVLARYTSELAVRYPFRSNVSVTDH